MKPACVQMVCPSCDMEYNIFLKKQPESLIVHCPRCDTTVSMHNGKTFIIDEETFEKIKTAKTRLEVNSIFNTVMKSPNDKLPISNDDVLNLAIQLNSCVSFDDVLKLM